MNVTKLSAVVLAAFLSGCAAPSPRPAPPIDLPARFAQDWDARQSQVASSDWWEVFDDPALHALVRQGLAANFDLRQAVERVQHSRALAAGARAELTPAGGVSLGTRTQQLSPFEVPGETNTGVRIDNAGAGVSMTWEMDVFGRLRNAALAAEARSEMVAADMAAMRVAVGAEIAHAWYALNGTRAKLRLMRRVVENRHATLDLVMKRAAVGYAEPLDEARARADLEAARSELPALEARLAASTHRLAVLLGESPSTYFPPPEPSSASVPELATLHVPEPWQWAQQRPDLRAAEARLHALALDVEAVRAEFLPRLSLVSTVGMVASSITTFGAAGIASWLVAPSLSLPLFDRPRIDARLQAARTEERAALLAYQQAVLRATEELETAMVQVRESFRRLSPLQERARQAAVAEQLARKRFEAGGSDLLELLDAERSAQQAEIALVTATTAQQQQVIALQRALVARFVPAANSVTEMPTNPSAGSPVADRS